MVFAQKGTTTITFQNVIFLTIFITVCKNLQFLQQKVHWLRVLILSCELGFARGKNKNCQEYQAIRPKKVDLGNLQSEFNFYVKNHQLHKKNLTNRLGGGIKRRFHVPKLSEGCSFFNPQKNQQKRLEC